jgi:hypothetical protein
MLKIFTHFLGHGTYLEDFGGGRKESDVWFRSAPGGSGGQVQ